jgi:hypothetical protein
LIPQPSRRDAWETIPPPGVAAKHGKLALEPNRLSHRILPATRITRGTPAVYPPLSIRMVCRAR